MLTTASYAYTQEQQQMCTGDAMRLCASEIPDVDRVTACMVRQRAQLSDGCKAVFRYEPPATATPASYSPCGPARQAAQPDPEQARLNSDSQLESTGAMSGCSGRGALIVWPCRDNSADVHPAFSAMS